MIEHEKFMRAAMEEARAAEAIGEVPIGAVVVHENKIIARAHNRREIDQDPLAHAELLALKDAAKVLGAWRLIGTTLYVTLEPCFMCAGGIVNSRVDRLVFGALDAKGGAVQSLANLCADDRLNHRVEVLPQVLEGECSAMLSEFFSKLRNR